MFYMKVKYSKQKENYSKSKEIILNEKKIFLITWKKKLNDTCAWTPNKVFMRLGSLGTWACVSRLGGERKS